MELSNGFTIDGIEICRCKIKLCMKKEGISIHWKNDRHSFIINYSTAGQMGGKGDGWTGKGEGRREGGGGRGGRKQTIGLLCFKTESFYLKLTTM
jgi:hypothetical protein